jgi:thymidylate synthase
MRTIPRNNEGEAMEAPRLNRGNIPVLHVSGRTLPEAWERAVLAVWDNGIDIRTEYDRKDSSGVYIDPPSKDATVIVEVTEPLGEPRIHKNFPGGPAELEVYRQEVVEGIHDHWVDPSDPDLWTYTYHGRLFSYEPTENLDDPDGILISPSKLLALIDSGEITDVADIKRRLRDIRVSPVDQIDYVIRKSVNAFYSRRTQAITWMPTADPATDDPPCLQRMWFRIAEDENGAPVLNMNTDWRSRDLYRAWFMNVYALTDLHRVIAERISEAWGREVKVGRYCDKADSLHIYGECFTTAEVGGSGLTIKEEFERRIEQMRTRPLDERTWRSDHPALTLMTEETREKLRQDPDYMRKGSG